MLPAIGILVVLLREPALLDAIGGPVAGVLSLCFSAGIVYAAVGAWRGSNAARYQLVSMAALYYAHYAWVNLIAAPSIVSPERVPTHHVRGLRGIVMIVAVLWYFLGNQNARKFYAAQTPSGEEASPQRLSRRQVE